MSRQPAIPALLAAALGWAAPSAMAAGAGGQDLCPRTLEGVSVTMDYDAAKAEWTARGYQDVSPAQLAGALPNNKLQLQFVRDGGAAAGRPGSATLVWQASPDDRRQVTVSYQLVGTVSGPLLTGGWSHGRMFLDRKAEFCPPDPAFPRDCAVDAIRARGPLAADNLQCTYSVAARLLDPRSGLITESVQRAGKSLDQDKTDLLRQMQNRRPPSAP
jgi:hypothetical protein